MRQEMRTLVNGEEVRLKDKEHTHGVMETDMRESGSNV